MPTTIHSTQRALKRDSSSIDLHYLLVCLCVVFAFLGSAFGLAKLIEGLRIQARTKRTNPAEVKASQLETQLEAPASLSTLPDVRQVATTILNSRIRFRRKPRPLDFRTGAIQYLKASPYLQYISAPRLYALRHPRRLCLNSPRPTPLRTVITATESGKLTWSTVAPQKPRIHMPLEHPAPLLHPSFSQNEVHLTDMSNFQIPLRGDVWSSLENMHGTANAVVGSHPAPIPLRERPVPAAPQISFPWVASGANFRFGLVRGNSVASGPHQFPVQAFIRSASGPAIRTPRPLSNSNVTVKLNNVSTNSAKSNSNATARKENAIPIR
ncbi:hypothetical protein C8R45DRAFT_1185704 [Mycena sanguinolenta]|nr:hypothetical protein C8R45DRAFT_1185704 [Mycena sanguinolenta]